MIKNAIFLALILFSINLYSKTINLRKIAYSKEWLSLIHYQKVILGQYKSTIDDPHFFISKEGRTNPYLELLKTIELLKDNRSLIGHFKKRPQCVFIQRTSFLKKIKILDNQKMKCQEYDSWKKGMGDKSISLIFSSYYSNNPASMFGHTFLRFGKDHVENNLLDYSVAYEANVDSDNDILYTIYGIFGGFKGNLNISPYYRNVRQYNSFENRDLYEYKLNLTKFQINMILRHLWELYSTTNSSYYFFDRNCTYFLAEILNIAHPDWNLEKGNFLFYHPAQLLINLKKINGLLSKVTFRPSMKKKLQYEIHSLKSTNYSKFKKIIRGKIKMINLNQNSIPAIDASLSFLNYKKFKSKFKLDNLDQLLFQKLLKRRSLLGLRKDKIQYDKIKRSFPEDSRGLSKISLGLQYKTELSQTLRYSLTGLDFIGSTIGLPPNSKLTALNINLTHNTKNTYIKNIKLLEMYSLNPINILESPLSWSLLIEMKRNDFFDSSELNIQTAIGKTMGNETQFFSLLIGPSVSFSKIHTEIDNLGVIINPLFAINIFNSIKIDLEASYSYFNKNKKFFNLNNTLSYSINNNSNISFSYQYIYFRKKISLSTLLYNHHF